MVIIYTGVFPIFISILINFFGPERTSPFHLQNLVILRRVFFENFAIETHSTQFCPCVLFKSTVYMNELSLEACTHDTARIREGHDILAATT